jgi:hypothetical protein
MRDRRFAVTALAALVAGLAMTASGAAQAEEVPFAVPTAQEWLSRVDPPKPPKPDGPKGPKKNHFDLVLDRLMQG